MVVTKHKVKGLNGTGQMIQEITQSIKQEKHKHLLYLKMGISVD